MHNRDIRTGIARLHGPLTSPKILCMHNSVLILSITSLYRSQPSSVVFACKTATFGPELQVSIGPRHHLSFCASKTVISSRIASLYGSQPSSVILCFQNSAFISRITSLYGSQSSSVDLCMQNSVHTTRINSLYGSQTSSMDLCMQNRDFRIRLASLYGSKTPHVVFACKTAPSGPEERVSMVPRHDLSLCACNTAWLAPE